MYLNPFTYLLGIKHSRFGRIIKSTFSERLHDAFWISFGRFNIQNFGINDAESDYYFNSHTFGILDYIFLPSLFTHLLSDLLNSFESDNLSLKLLLWSSNCLSILLYFPKLTAGLIVLVAALPLIVIIHPIATIIRNYHLKRIDKIALLPIEEVDNKYKLSSLNSTLLLKNLDDPQFSSNPATTVTGMYTFISPVFKNDTWNQSHSLVGSYDPTRKIYLGVYKVFFKNYGGPPVYPKPLFCAAIDVNANNWEGIKSLYTTDSFLLASSIKRRDYKVDIYKEMEKQIFSLAEPTFFPRPISPANESRPVERIIESYNVGVARHSN